MEDFNNLLFKESFIQKFQDKWVKNLSDGYIEVMNQAYKMKVTENKRRLIYDSNNKLIGTKPFIINSNIEIIN
jgi:acylphosphatase